MNDRYLYRAKRTDNGEWVEGNLIIFEECAYAYIMETDNTYIRTHYTCEDCVEFNMRVYKVDPSTICQCTGLKDKNGKMICENDIVRYCDCTVENYVIAWEENKVCFEYQQYGCSIMNFDELSGIEVEVIGNIFDNPEMLEVGE